MPQAQETGWLLPSQIADVAYTNCHPDKLCNRAQTMSRPLQYGREERTVKSEKADDPRSDHQRSDVPCPRILPDTAITLEVVHLSGDVIPPSTLTSAWRPNPARPPGYFTLFKDMSCSWLTRYSAIGSRDWDFQPTPWLSGSVSQEARAFSSADFVPSTFTGTVAQEVLVSSSANNPFSNFSGVGILGTSAYSRTATPFSRNAGAGISGTLTYSNTATPFSTFTDAGRQEASDFSRASTPASNLARSLTPQVAELPR